jgi:hypothetical protein
MNEKMKTSTKEAHAYTPGLKVKRSIEISKTRTLPIPGDVLFEEGSAVDFKTIIARAKVPGKPEIVKAYQILNLAPENIPPFMVKKVGDAVEKEEIIAKYTPFWGLIKKFVYSPTDGTIESISDITGQVIIREPPTPVEIDAYLKGKVSDVFEERGIIITANGSLIQGIFGVGGENHGELKMVANSPDERLTADKITPDLEGKIIVGGSLVTLDALKKAQDLGVRGIIVGGKRGVDISEFLGYEIGVAITGQEDLPISLILTEGFGEIPMSRRVFDLLKEFEGSIAAINGATQIRAGVIRPEIIIVHDQHEETTDEFEGGMKPGTLVRIIREPYFAKIGTVVSLPIHLQEIETMSKVRVVEVEIDEGKVIVPRANVEMIEK